MTRITRFLRTPFGLASLGCLILAGWALWSGGILDGPVARGVRSASVYVAPGADLDRAAAERIIGNRRLVVLMMAPGADLRDACHSVGRAADGTLVVAMSRHDDQYDNYGCSRLPGAADENFGQAAVAETVIHSGVDSFADRPLEAMKVLAVNYDQLVKADVVPDGARTISPSLPRYLIAVAAVLAVLLGAAAVYAAGRRAARTAGRRRARRDEQSDAQAATTAAAAVLAQQIIDLDQRYAVASRPGAGKAERAFATGYRKLTSDYVELLDTAPDPQRLEALSTRCRKLAEK